MPLKVSQLMGLLIFFSPLTLASHNYGGLDLCTLYPQTMPPGLPAEKLPDANGQSAQLMQTYCTQCHELPGPGQHTAKQWPQVLQRMLAMMDSANRFSGLLGHIKTPDAQQRVQLKQYLNQYALKPMQQEPEGFGAKAFANHCDDCHSLPDPLQYSNENLPELLKRMQNNMKVMKYTLPSSEVMLQIQHYLQSSVSLPLISNEPYHRIGGNQPEKSSSMHIGRWLAVGPLFILLIVGVVRWILNSAKTHHQIKP